MFFEEYRRLFLMSRYIGIIGSVLLIGIIFENLLPCSTPSRSMRDRVSLTLFGGKHLDLSRLVDHSLPPLLFEQLFYSEGRTRKEGFL